jgi:parvulin-like peptidyl-prolyl isomerase
VKRAAADTRARVLLVLGVVAGVLLAGWGLVTSGTTAVTLPDDMVALVNGEPITAEAFARLEAAVKTERRGASLDEAQRQRLLDRLVDEELLLQRGIDLGLARHEPSARRAIVSAVVAAVTADAEAAEPDEETLRRFHSDAAERFQRPGRVAVDVLLASTSTWPEAQAFQRAVDGARRLRAGDSFESVSQSLGDRQLAELPAGPLPLETLREYLGPSAAQATAQLAPGEVTEPVRGAGGYYVIRLRERMGGETIPFEEVREQVRAEWLREQGERALADYLEELRRGGEVQARLPSPSANGVTP